MQLTKYEHACFTVEKDGQTVVVDPGSFTSDFKSPDSVVCVVITHNHADHLSEETLSDIIKKNPNAVVVGPADVTKLLTSYDTRTVSSGDNVTIGNFRLDFYGNEHAVIHPDMPIDQNVGVLINEKIYFPGDSLTVPDKPVDVLALPVGGPWLKNEESIEFMKSVNAQTAFPTHDAVLSDGGKQVADSMIGSFAEKAGTSYQRIDGETIDVQ